MKKPQFKDYSFNSKLFAEDMELYTNFLECKYEGLKNLDTALVGLINEFEEVKEGFALNDTSFMDKTTAQAYKNVREMIKAIIS